MIGASTFDKVQQQLSSIRAESTRMQRRMADRAEESSSEEDDEDDVDYRDRDHRNHQGEWLRLDHSLTIFILFHEIGGNNCVIDCVKLFYSSFS